MESDRTPAEDVEKTNTVVRRSFDWATTLPSVAIVLVLSEITEQGMWGDKHETLADYVDPDALDAIVTQRRDEAAAVGLSVDGYRIRVDDQGVGVHPPAEGAH